MIKRTLEELYAEHSGNVSDKWSIYLSEYDRIFSKYRDWPVHLLEIGIQNGGSLEIWSKYFANAQSLVGCDINPDCAALSYGDPRVTVVIGDANNATTSEKIYNVTNRFDIVIDDGSHRSSDIVKTFAKYFPVIEDGGVFVAEDLHCSYWKEFEGGLFDPYSSISFFKRLSDVLNHEHWGVEKNPGQVLNGFFARYGCNIDDETLLHIHSIEFVNSLCVVRKESPEKNRAGKRVIAGSAAPVVPHIKNMSEDREVLRQDDNQWAVRRNSPDQDLDDCLQELKQIRNELLHRNEELKSWTAENSRLKSANEILGNSLAAIQNSTIWRYTRPLRIIGKPVKRAVHLAKITPVVIARGGGVKSTALKALEFYRREGLSGIKRGLTIAQSTHQNSASQRVRGCSKAEYLEWIRQYDTLTDRDRAAISQNVEKLVNKPLISVVMPTYNTKLAWLIQAIESVQKQIYPHWELCIADDASPNTQVRDTLRKYAEKDSRIKIAIRKENGHISLASNSALKLVTGEWVALLDHDDFLPEHALYWVADAINRNPQALLFYSDEDKVDEKGLRFDPYFKCDWNPALFYSHNLFSHLGVYSKSLLNKVGGFRVGLEGSQDYDLALRCTEQIEPSQIVHIPRILYHWRIHSDSTAKSAEAKPYAAIAAERALNDHFKRTNVAAVAQRTEGGYRVRYALPTLPPMVSLIIPTRNGLNLIRQCIDSILNKTTYPNYEILIVDNGSDDPNVLDYFNEISRSRKVKVLRDDRPFNYSALNNAAVKRASGDLIGLVNNDIEVISPEWLTEMVSHAIRPHIGAVGARLWYPDNTLQHGGVLLGVGGVANHSHFKISRGDPGYFCRAALIQNFSAVTAACLVVKKSIYEEVGGLNEVDLQVAFNDVDFCLRVRAAGYQNLWTPYADLYHHESATRGADDTPEKQARFAKEVAYMTGKWADELANDPAYSPNLSLAIESDFTLAWPPRVEPISERS